MWVSKVFQCLLSVKWKKSQVLLNILLMSRSPGLSHNTVDTRSHVLRRFVVHRPRPLFSALTSALCRRLCKRHRNLDWVRTEGPEGTGAVRARPRLRTCSFRLQFHMSTCWKTYGITSDTLITFTCMYFLSCVLGFFLKKKNKIK